MLEKSSSRRTGEVERKELRPRTWGHMGSCRGRVGCGTRCWAGREAAIAPRVMIITTAVLGAWLAEWWHKINMSGHCLKLPWGNLHEAVLHSFIKPSLLFIISFLYLFVDLTHPSGQTYPPNELTNLPKHLLQQTTITSRQNFPRIIASTKGYS